MKKKNRKEDIATPLVLLIVYSMFSAYETLSLPRNISFHNSALFPEPVLFADNFFLSLSHLFWFAVPALLIIYLLEEDSVSLKCLYLLGVIPFVLTRPVIIYLDMLGLYVVKIGVCYILTICLFKHILAAVERHMAAPADKKGPTGTTGTG